MGRFERGDAHPAVAFANVELHALPGGVAELSHGRTGGIDEGPAASGGAAEGDQSGTEDETTLGVSGHQPVTFEGDGEAVCSRPTQPGRRHQLRQRARVGLEGVDHQDRLVENADTTYTRSHESRLLSH